MRALGVTGAGILDHHFSKPKFFWNPLFKSLIEKAPWRRAVGMQTLMKKGLRRLLKGGT